MQDYYHKQPKQPQIIFRYIARRSQSIKHLAVLGFAACTKGLFLSFDTFKNKIHNQNPRVFSKLYDKEKWVLVDLRTLRLRMRYDNSITADTYRIIEKYDYVLVSPEILK